MKQFQRVQWLVLLVVVALVATSCQFGDRSRHNVTSPITDPVDAANLWVGRGDGRLTIAPTTKLLQFRTPAGTYLLQYQAKTENEDGTFSISGTFAMVFTAGADGAMITIGLLPGAELWSVSLQPGAIPDGVTPVMEDGDVLVYLTPAMSTTVAWEGVFTIDFDIELIVIMADGELNEELEDIEIVEVATPPLPEVVKLWTIYTNVNDDTLGTITPALEQAPDGSSRSFKIHPVSGVFADIDQVMVNGTDVTAQVQKLGNGDGHLVLHNITSDVFIEVVFLAAP